MLHTKYTRMNQIKTVVYAIAATTFGVMTMLALMVYFM